MNALGGTFSHPRDNLERIVIGEGSTVIDLGAGSGHYAQAASELVGPEGRVYAIDIQKDLVRRLHGIARTNKLHNMEVIHGDIEKIGGSKIAGGTAEVTLLCNVLFQVEHKDDLVQEALRVTRPGGRVCIIDWVDSNFGMGPDAELIVSQEDARALFEHHAEFVSEFDAGDHHYGIIMRKK